MTTPPPGQNPDATPDPGQAPEVAGGAAPVPPTPVGPPSYPAYPAGQPGYPLAPPGAVGPTPGAWAGSGTAANNLAVWSLALAIAGWVCFGLLTTIPAIVVGARAKRAAAEGRASNPGMATAGFVLGWIGTVLNVLGIIATAVIIANLGWDGFVDLLEEYGATTP